MKKYLVIGNPIEHSLSPKMHNHWIKNEKINAIYEKRKLNKNEIKDLIGDIKDQKINGINVTVPFKQEVIPYLDELTEQAKKTQSVNTIYLGANGITGHNTDIEGFEESLRYVKYNVKDKDVLILGLSTSIPFTLRVTPFGTIILLTLSSIVLYSSWVSTISPVKVVPASEHFLLLDLPWSLKVIVPLVDVILADLNIANASFSPRLNLPLCLTLPFL